MEIVFKKDTRKKAAEVTPPPVEQETPPPVQEAAPPVEKAEDASPELVKIEAPELEGPKILDKIDLSAIDSSTRPKKGIKKKAAAEEPAACYHPFLLLPYAQPPLPCALSSFSMTVAEVPELPAFNDCGVTMMMLPGLSTVWTACLKSHGVSKRLPSPGATSIPDPVPAN